MSLEEFREAVIKLMMSRGYAEHKSREEIEETIDGENKDIFDSAFGMLNERGADWCITYAAWNISMCI